MKTKYLLALHKRQVDLLDMVTTCEERIKMWKLDKRIHAGNWIVQSMNDHADKNIARNAAIRQRLISYYKDIQVRIMSLQPEIELNETESAHAIQITDKALS